MVFGIVVEGLPQHRFQPFHFSFTAGKHDSVPTDTARSAAAPVEPIIPVEEPAPQITAHEEPNPVQEQVQQAPVDETSPVEKAPGSTKEQHMWKKAAMNLVNIPHLLRWVSSLNPDTLMTTLREQQEVVKSKPQNLPTEASEQVMPPEENAYVNQDAQISRNMETVEVVTNLYETDSSTTEEPQMVQEEIVESQPQMMHKVVTSARPEIEVQPYKPVSSTKGERIDEVHVEQPEIPVKQEVAYAEPEPVEVVAPIQLEPIVETQIKNVAEPQSQITEAYVEPQRVEAHQNVQPHEIYRGQAWQRRQHRYEQPRIQTYDKPAFTENKKPYSKFKSNKYDSRKQQSLKKGKTLFNFSPAAPQRENPFSFSSFAFPAYSYSISHTPTHSHWTGR